MGRTEKIEPPGRRFRLDSAGGGIGLDNPETEFRSPGKLTTISYRALLQRDFVFPASLTSAAVRIVLLRFVVCVMVSVNDASAQDAASPEERHEDFPFRAEWNNPRASLTERPRSGLAEPQPARAIFPQRSSVSGTWLDSGGGDGLGIVELDLSTTFVSPFPWLEQTSLLNPKVEVGYVFGREAEYESDDCKALF